MSGVDTAHTADTEHTADTTRNYRPINRASVVCKTVERLAKEIKFQRLHNSYATMHIWK